jgi:hypothetical protein
MNVPLLIDAIVRQTMVLIAQLSTASGHRSPLSHVADRVFLDLVAELERQRVGKKVIADMFGLALRSYQQKVARLAQSATDTGATLWSAVHAFILEQQVASKVEILRRFARDDEVSVRGILSDLVESGLVYHSGKGDAAIYRIAEAGDWDRTNGDAESETLVAWLFVYRDGPATRRQVANASGLAPEVVDRALATLLADGRIRIVEDAPEPRYGTDHCLVPLGNEAGWEAAVIDHHRALVSALAAKIRAGKLRSARSDEIGGSTFTFELTPAHPFEAEIRGLLARFRREMAELWDRVCAHNAGAPKTEEGYRATFYFGQYLELEENDDRQA